MARSDSTTSSTPFSPFSSYSAASDATSDDLPDLGAFTNVFRALNDFNQGPRGGIPIPIAQLDHRTPTSSLALMSPSSDSNTPSRVWSRGTAVSYLSNSWQDTASFHSPTRRSHSASEHLSDASNTEGEDSVAGEEEAHTYTIDAVVNFIQQQEDGEPSLGYLDEALGFIAAERARLLASRDVIPSKASDNRSSTSENAWKHVIQPRRKRRRNKPSIKSRSQGPSSRTPLTIGVPDLVGQGMPGEEVAVDESASSSAEASSSPYYKSSPVTPRGREREKRGSGSDSNSKLLHTRSTPSLRLIASPSTPLDPRLLKLRALAHKLRLLFPEESARLASILSHDHPDKEDFVDPRGPTPQTKDNIVHVFVDHSNILIGFLNYLRRHPTSLMGKSTRRLSHAALALILERGRSVTRRVLVASSPLYQPIESAEQLGYEVRIYARVPDLGDGMDRQPTTGTSSSGDSSRGAATGEKHKKHASLSSILKAQARNNSPTVTTSESDPGAGSTGIPPISKASTTSVHGASTVTTPARIKYREQGVDELLQLKLHQAIAEYDVPPLGATIVLATGDGNVGQFNEEGFLGCVRTALKKGWRVELYAWEGGLSKSWKREFGDGLYRDRFTIIGLSKFGSDLLEV